MASKFGLLVRLAEENYQPWKVPGPHDGEIASALAAVDSVGSFEEIAAMVDRAVARILTAFACRMATLGLRRRDLVWVERGLVAAQLAMPVEGDRDVLPSYALLFRAAELIEADAMRLFRELSYLREDPTYETPQQFAERAAADRSIEGMGYSLVNERTGPTFRPTHWTDVQ